MGRHGTREPTRCPAPYRPHRSMFWTWEPTASPCEGLPWGPIKRLGRCREGHGGGTSAISGRSDNGAMNVLAATIDRALDLAFPASCPGCRTEGQPICAVCRASLQSDLERPPGVPIG